MLIPSTKICLKCNQDLDLNCFYNKSLGKYGKDSICINCKLTPEAKKRRDKKLLTEQLEKQNNTKLKNCTKCDIIKTLDHFYNHKIGLYGKRNVCIDCSRTSQAKAGLLERQKVKNEKLQLSGTDLKRCSKCKTVKYKIFFNKLEKASDGLTSWCKECSNNNCANKRRKEGKQSKSYRRDSIDQILGEAGFKICLNCFKVLSLDLYRNSKNGYLQTNSYCNHCHNERYISNLSESKRQHQSALVKKRRQNNPDKYRLIQRIAQANRRARKQQSSDGTVTNKVLKELYAKEFCYYCKQFTPKEKRTIEHKIPLSKGGLHSVLNIEMACSFCNTSKKDKTDLEYLQKLQQKID